MNRKLLTTLLLIAIQSHGLLAQKAPVWTNFQLRESSYPASTYLTGFISETNYKEENPADMLQRLHELAKDQLVENIVVDIRSISTYNLTTVNTQTTEIFKRNSTSFSQAKIAGLSIETYYDKKEKAAYAFAFAKKSDVIDLYEKQISQRIINLQQEKERATSLLQQKNNQEALRRLFACQTLFRQLEEDQTLLAIVSGSLDHPGLKIEAVQKEKIEVDAMASRLSNQENFTLEDAAFYMASALRAQVDNADKPVRLRHFSFHDTPMSSPFSRRFTSTMEQKLVQETGWKIANEGVAEQQTLVFSGTYWLEGDKLKLIGILRNMATAEALASSECYLPISSLQQIGIVYEPENYRQALAEQQALAKGELKGGELQVDVFTNKGKENLIYTRGESLKLFVRANRECYLRFVYHLADGSKVLLMDNYYVNRDKVNVAYELPYEFECDAPFGVETLQLNAQTMAFESIPTRSEYGYDFIIADTEAILSKTRGFKPKEGKVLKAEKRMVITTMEK